MARSTSASLGRLLASAPCCSQSRSSFLSRVDSERLEEVLARLRRRLCRPRRGQGLRTGAADSPFLLGPKLEAFT